MNIRNYIIDSFGGVRYIWKTKLKFSRNAIAEIGGHTFNTDLKRVSAETKQKFTHIVPELVGEDFWFVNFISPTGFQFGMDDKSRKAAQMLINQLKDVIRETRPKGFIFEVNSRTQWELKRLYEWILVPTFANVLGYPLYTKKQIAYNLYYIFRKA